MVSITYLRRIERSRRDTINGQEQFSTTDQSTTVGTLLNGTDCKILIDNGATMVCSGVAQNQK